MLLLFFSNKIDNSFMIVYASLGILLSGIYIVIDLCVIMKPGAIPMDDYILGSLMLYADIIRMFVFLVMLLGKR